MLQPQGEAVLQPIVEETFEKRGIKLFLKREDLLHSQISGNKWRKLKYNLQAAIDQGQKKLLTFGGAYSNHIYATAAAAKEVGLDSIGVIRGERSEPLNATLAFAEQAGMHLHFVSRSLYREKEEAFFIKNIHEQFGDFYLVPEGGSNTLAVKGCTEIVEEIDTEFDYLCTAVGTGGTIAGLIASEQKAKVIGFSALKGDFLQNDVKKLLNEYSYAGNVNWLINNEYHFGGYAKFKPELIDFIKSFKQKHNIQLDPVYTGKMLFGIYDLIEKDYFDNDSTIVALHTGGLQGLAGFKERYGVEF